MTAIADDLLLVLLDDETGKPRLDQTRLDYALGGAVLLELAMDHRIDVLPGPPRRAHVVVRDSRPVADEILDDVLREVRAKRRRADRLVPVVSKGLRLRLLQRAERNGLIRLERRRLLGLFPVDRWPAADSRPRRELVGRLRQVLVDGMSPDPRTSALVALLSSVGAADTVVGPLPRAERKAVQRRAKEIGEGAWAAEAVQKAVVAVQAAVAAGATTAVLAATTASS